MKDKDEIETRIAELGTERERLSSELENARTKARNDLIEGKKPAGIAAALAERIGILDDAMGELQSRLRGAVESTERNNRRRRAEAALEATAKRAKLAADVDNALAALATNWTVYADALRKDVGQVAGAGGDVNAVERALTNNRTAEPLVKALIRAGGVSLARSLGIDSPIRERHSGALAHAEERVAESLQVELLRIKASSPQPNIAHEAKVELDQMETTR